MLSPIAQKVARKYKQSTVTWPDQYRNRLTGKTYNSHNAQEHTYVYSDTPRYMLLKGGEGGGKSTASIIKTLNRLRRGMNGIMVGPDFEHFKISLWPEFARWCPWQCVIPKQQYRQQAGWEPSKKFTLVFIAENGKRAELICGGIEESQVEAWEGPNVSFVHFDEARRHKEAGALKVFDGRARIPGPKGEPPQIYISSTPRKHWMFDYFAGTQGDEQSDVPEKTQEQWRSFRSDAYCATVLTQENEDAGNLEAGFTEKRAQSLDEGEARIKVKAMWEEESDVEKFVNIIWWDNCMEQLPSLGRSEPLVIALDASKGSTNTGYVADTFAMVAVSRHPHRPTDIAVRYCGIWQPELGKLLDYDPIEKELIRLCQEFAIVEVAYDPTQLHKMCYDLKQKGVAHFREFNQSTERLKSDKSLQTLIINRQIAHDGNPLLRQHIDNANAKKYNDGSSNEDSIRIVKRNPNLKVDAAVALGMAAARSLYYRLG